MNSCPELRLDWCSHEAAKYAVEKWHYSRVMPRMKLVRIGAWEDGAFVGCVIFSCGATGNLGKPYGISTLEVCELTRVAFGRHKTMITKILSVAFKMLKRHCPALRLVVSFADPAQGHHGGIYQGGGWIYNGLSAAGKVYFDANGIKRHSRNVKARSYRDRNGVINYAKSLMVRCEDIPGKHRYLMPLDDDMRAKIAPLAKPYPKRAGSAAGGTSATHAERGGSIPTPALSDIPTGG